MFRLKYQVIFYETNSGKRLVEEFIERLLVKDSAKIIWYFELLEEHGKNLPKQYLKHIRGGIWEIRPKKYKTHSQVKAKLMRNRKFKGEFERLRPKYEAISVIKY